MAPPSEFSFRPTVPSSSSTLMRRTPTSSTPSASAPSTTTAQPTYKLLFHVLPTDLVHRILDFLSIADIHHLRRAGAGAHDPETHQLLHTVMRRRVRRLQAIWSAMTLEDVDKNFPKFLPRAWPSTGAQDKVLELLREGVPKQDPDDFLALNWRGSIRAWPPKPTYVSKVADILYLSYLTADAAVAIAKEMPDLLRLNIRGTSVLGAISPWGPFCTVPNEVAQCQQLKSLTLSCSIEEVPEPILKMSGLVDLVFDWDCQLKELPDNIGADLPNLRFVELQGSPLSSLPRSLLDTVEKNRNRKWPGLPVGYGIIVSEHHFPPGYWEEILGKDRPPRYPPPSRMKKGLVFRADP